MGGKLALLVAGGSAYAAAEEEEAEVEDDRLSAAELSVPTAIGAGVTALSVKAKPF